MIARDEKLYTWPDRGDKIRAHHLLKHLSTLAPVHVGCFAETDKDFAAEPELASIAASHCLVRRSKPLVLAGAEAVLAGKPVSLTAFHSRALAGWVARTIAERDIATVFVFSGQMGQYIPESFDGRVVVDLCDVDSVKFEDYADAGERVWLNHREGRLLAEEEERLAHRAHTTLLISENERNVFLPRLRHAAETRVLAIGNGIDAGFFDPAKVTPHAQISERPGPHFVFTGQMDYRPNEVAACWTIEQFLPVMRAQHPSAEFHVVGRNPTERLLALKDRAGVTVWGEVADVRPFLAAADMAITPLTIARGVQNKVLEAMAMQLPVMLTPEAATGIDAVDGEDWLVDNADGPAMVARFDTFWGDPAKREEMARSARRFVLDHHSWPAMLAPLDDMVFTGEASRHAA